jgi:hypothetical protein
VQTVREIHAEEPGPLLVADVAEQLLEQPQRPLALGLAVIVGGNYT